MRSRARKPGALVEFLPGDEHEPIGVQLEGITGAFVLNLLQFGERRRADVIGIRFVSSEGRFEAPRNAFQVAGVRAHVLTHPKSDPATHKEPEGGDDDPRGVGCEERQEP